MPVFLQLRMPQVLFLLHVRFPSLFYEVSSRELVNCAFWEALYGGSETSTVGFIFGAGTPKRSLYKANGMTVPKSSRVQFPEFKLGTRCITHSNTDGYCGVLGSAGENWSKEIVDSNEERMREEHEIFV